MRKGTRRARASRRRAARGASAEQRFVGSDGIAFSDGGRRFYAYAATSPTVSAESRRSALTSVLLVPDDSYRSLATLILLERPCVFPSRFASVIRSDAQGHSEDREADRDEDA